ncbi:uncharacterized protein FLJ46347 isoform X7 [Maniola hyperantus]|uniref:uncharacterized protein FLJ46347 isoform X7 n=1 Tax=Aphantopus hyperantus TaxID=2795564 RepID=UPI003747BB79
MLLLQTAVDTARDVGGGGGREQLAGREAAGRGQALRRGVRRADAGMQAQRARRAPVRPPARRAREVGMLQDATGAAARRGVARAGRLRAAVRGEPARQRGAGGVPGARVRRRPGAARRVRGAARPQHAHRHAAVVRRRRRSAGRAARAGGRGRGAGRGQRQRLHARALRLLHDARGGGARAAGARRRPAPPQPHGRHVPHQRRAVRAAVRAAAGARRRGGRAGPAAQDGAALRGAGAPPRHGAPAARPRRQRRAALARRRRRAAHRRAQGRRTGGGAAAGARADGRGARGRRAGAAGRHAAGRVQRRRGRAAGVAPRQRAARRAPGRQDWARGGGAGAVGRGAGRRARVARAGGAGGAGGRRGRAAHAGAARGGARAGRQAQGHECRAALVARPVHKKQAETFDRALRCVTHLLHLLLQTAPDDEPSRERVTRQVARLVAADVRSAHTGDSLLHLCASRLNVVRSTYFADELGAPPVFPSARVVRLLLRAGADARARNEARSTPLHVAAIPYNFSTELVSVLLAGGAHLDQPNKFGDSAAELVPLNRGSRVCVLRHVSLACLAARAVLASRQAVPACALPATLHAFLALHCA